METNCGNTIAEIGKKNCGNCGNGIAEIGGGKKIPSYFHFFFFFKEKICAHNFYNISTTNFKWQVVIVGLKK